MELCTALSPVLFDLFPLPKFFLILYIILCVNLWSIGVVFTLIESCFLNIKR